MLNNAGLPKKEFPNRWKGVNGLYCAGLGWRGSIVHTARDEGAGHLLRLLRSAQLLRRERGDASMLLTTCMWQPLNLAHRSTAADEPWQIGNE